jgi:mannonate dehydratase
MAGIGWFRTAVTLPERGGALTSGFDIDALKDQPLTEYGEVSEEKIWQNYAYFIRAVLPAAEEAGVVMGLHPDDPPISPVRGIGRILTSAAAFERALAIYPSPNHGITFCQANFAAMGEDVDGLIRKWAKKIAFVHFRDIQGSAERFVETFHDNGPTDMPRRLQLYHEVGFGGPIRPDHAPTMEGEENLHPGYEILGQLYAIAYMKGIMHALHIPVE